MYKNAIKMLGRAIFERFYQIFGVFIPKNMVFFGFQSGVFFGVLRFPFGVFGPKLSGHTEHKIKLWNRSRFVARLLKTCEGANAKPVSKTFLVWYYLVSCGATY